MKNVAVAEKTLPMNPTKSAIARGIATVSDILKTRNDAKKIKMDVNVANERYSMSVRRIAALFKSECTSLKGPRKYFSENSPQIR